jgi:hypothetical protein
MPVMKKYSPFAAIAFLLLTVCLSAPKNVYSSWANFPRSTSFPALAPEILTRDGSECGCAIKEETSMGGGAHSLERCTIGRSRRTIPQRVATVLVLENQYEKS